MAHSIKIIAYKGTTSHNPPLSIILPADKVKINESSFNVFGTTTLGSNILTISPPIGLLEAGQRVEGVGIGAGTIVSVVNSPTSVTLSVNSTLTGFNVLTVKETRVLDYSTSIAREYTTSQTPDELIGSGTFDTTFDRTFA